MSGRGTDPGRVEVSEEFEETSRLQPSASKTDLLLACPRPFDPGVVLDLDPSGEPARYGSSFHQVIAACLRSPKKAPLEKNTARYSKEIEKAVKKHNVAAAIDELRGHVKSSVKFLRNWIEREGLEVVVVEKAYAIRPLVNGTWVVRDVAPHDENHKYDVEAFEVPGTVDLILKNNAARRIVVLDHKTGLGTHDSFSIPTRIPQMRTLGLVAGKMGLWDVEVAIFHADRLGLPIVYSESYERSAMQIHAAELHEALFRIGSGFLRPNQYCSQCPARSTCPAKAAELISEGTEALIRSANALAVEPIDPAKFGILAAPENGLSVEERAAVLYDLLKKFRALEKAGTEEIRRLVRAGANIETRDGKMLSLRENSYETLSKKSVVEALGKVAGEKEIAKLRKKGAMRETVRQTLWADK